MAHERKMSCRGHGIEAALFRFTGAMISIMFMEFDFGMENRLKAGL
jgi:hypothetical protein